ncbi:MAG: hypothetical protein A3J08_01515 [Candidatus Lloydbacteria bacterium RIFCSPLOWO2_02_FULL_51_11]|uniref:Uncharacterized protein n=1 Tax=Candidatus Lloydbacteria bacterium RIFCSPLOWO2_02_FULL_51_11 TaxID=1798667 RepID=A0A1G2DQ48_9BACT|nr:MAG: hypothetical protein A3J08_01515 [Candidatus Lloydbacteria bacterium RIFCSPLOWO2_02_FULL_51_11]
MEGPPKKTPESVPAQELQKKNAPSQSAEMPIMITQDMQARLLGKGLDQKTIDTLTSEAAWEILGGATTEKVFASQFEEVPRSEKKGVIQNEESTGAPVESPPADQWDALLLGDEPPKKEGARTESKKESGHAPDELFGITAEEFSSVEGWGALTVGQQRLVRENLKQITLARVKEESAVRYKEGIAGAREGKTLWGRLWEGLKANVTRPYQTLATEKKTAEEFMKGGMEVHGEALSYLVKNAKNGPEVDVKEDGSLEFIYLSRDLDALTPEYKEKAGIFNETATAFARIPDEWKYDTANERQRRAHEKAKESYDSARAEIIKGIIGSETTLGEGVTKESVEKNALLYVSDVDGMVRMNQFFNTHPDAEQELAKIENGVLWKKVVANTLTEKAGYGLFGYGARWAGTAAMGFVAAPLVAAGMGGYLGRKRAHERIRAQEVGARTGTKGGYEAWEKNIVPASQLVEKLERAVKQVSEIDEKAPSVETKKHLASLAARIEYTQRKIGDELVGFGRAEERAANRYALLEALSSARVTTEAKTAGASEEIRERLFSFLNFKEESIPLAQGNYLNREMIRGVVVAAGFSLLGAAIRDYFFAKDPLLTKANIGKVAGGFGDALYQGKDDAENFFAGKADTVARWTRGWFADEVGGVREDAVFAIAQENMPAGSGANLLNETEDHFSAPGGRPPHLPPLFAEGVVTPSSPNETFPYQGGNSIWKESELQLRALFKEDFATLGGKDAQATEALKTWNIGRLKETIVKNPVEYGLPKGVNVDRLTLEQLKNVKWGDAVRDTFRGGGLTSELSPDKLAKIAGNNETLRTFFNTHPNAPRTSENYEAILRGMGHDGETAPTSGENKLDYERTGSPPPGSQIDEYNHGMGDSGETAPTSRESDLDYERTGSPPPGSQIDEYNHAPTPPDSPPRVWDVTKSYDPEIHGPTSRYTGKGWDESQSYDKEIHGPTSQYTGKEEIPPISGGFGGVSPDMPPPPVLEGMKIKIPLGEGVVNEIEKVFEKDPGYMAQARAFLEDYLETYKTEHNDATVSEDKLAAFVSEMDEIDEWVMKALFKNGGDSPENRLTLMKTILGHTPLTPGEAKLWGAGTYPGMKKFDLNRWNLDEIRHLEDFIEDGPFGEHLKKVLAAGNAVSYETRRERLVEYLVGQQRDFVDRTQIPLPGVGAENREYSTEFPASPSRYSFDLKPKRVDK